jgi:hypothetical protein
VEDGCAGISGAGRAARVTFSIPTPVYSQNDLRGRWKHPKAYRRLRNQYEHDVTYSAMAAKVPKATGKRRLSVTRLYCGRARPFDPTNLYGGAKPLVDAIVRAGLLVDDKAEWLELGTWGQERTEKTTATRITLEDV